MALHLIKLCVGCDSIEDLADWQAERLKARRKAGEKRPQLFHRTFQTPNGADLVLPGRRVQPLRDVDQPEGDRALPDRSHGRVLQ